MTSEISTVFPAVAPSASGARRFVTSALRRAGVSSERIALATLLTSELVTNAYRHAGSDTRVSVHAGDEHVRIEVVDSGPGELRVLSPGSNETDGRGLQIVEALSDRWGHETTSEGTTVWFELDCGRKNGRR